MASAAASQVSIDLGIRGPAFSVTSACASTAHAVAQAVLLIRSGRVEVALAGGTDAPLTPGLLKSWEALRVLSPDACRPFSHDRNGLVLGEGAGVVVLETEGHARARGAKSTQSSPASVFPRMQGISQIRRQTAPPPRCVQH